MTLNVSAKATCNRTGAGSVVDRVRTLIVAIGATMVVAAFLAAAPGWLPWHALQSSAAGNVITSPDTGGDVGFYTSIALDENGNPVIAHQDLTEHTLRLVHCGDPNCSGGNVITSHSPGLQSDTYLSLVLDADGRPVVSYYDSDERGLSILHCGDPNCGVAEANAKAYERSTGSTKAAPAARERASARSAVRCP